MDIESILGKSGLGLRSDIHNYVIVLITAKERGYRRGVGERGLREERSAKLGCLVV